MIAFSWAETLRHKANRVPLLVLIIVELGQDCPSCISRGVVFGSEASIGFTTVYCMVVALDGYGWYLLDMDGIWNSVDAV